MAVPWKVNLRSLFVRKTNTVLTIVGVGLVIMVFVLSASLTNGLETVLRATGDPRHVIVLRAAARSELESYFSREAYSIIATRPEIDRDASGKPLIVAELFTVINQTRRGSGGESANVIVRGVQPTSFTLRPEVKLARGRLFTPGLHELVASTSIARRFDGAGLGETIRLRGIDFTIVGLFDAGGTAWDSEVWGDFDTLAATYNRLGGGSSATLSCADPAARKRLTDALAKDPRLNLKAMGQVAYFEEQTNSALLLKVLTWILTIVLSIGACFFAANTMYAAVASRTREIGTLRALGFSRGSILVAYVAESLALSLLSGAFGVGLAAIVLVFVTGPTGTNNQNTFAEIAFSFRLTPTIAGAGVALSAVLGVVGGFLPARLASRLPITQALRQI
jgi:putative ABC transport system permease protein